MVNDGAGVLMGANNMDVHVVCSTNTYTIGGTVTGLATNNSLSLLNNLGDTLAISANGAFTFASSMIDEMSFDVTVMTQPSSPNQTCLVSFGTGTLAGTNITGVEVNCSINTYSIGGSLSGLNAGNDVILQNNLGDNLTLSANGLFAFSDELDDESSFEVTVLSQPTSPNQTCLIGSSMGTLSGSNITGITVTCSLNKYTIGGTVSGLQTGNTLTLQNNLGDDLPINADGIFTFATTFDDHSVFNITVLNQPSEPNQICTVSAGSGTFSGANITNVSIICDRITYTVGGTISGLAVNNSVLLQNNANDNLSINANGSFTFVTALDDDSSFEVTVLSQPTTPNQNCTISNGSGTLSGSNFSNVSIICSTIQYTVSGNVTGLAVGNSLTIQNNGSNSIVQTTNGLFTFNSQDDGTEYLVSVSSHPTTPNQTCVVSNGSGSLIGSSITTVAIECTTGVYSIGGMISGLATGNYMVLQNNAGDDLTVSANGAFIFTTLLTDETNYAITVLTQPLTPTQMCSIAGGSSANNNGTGTIAGTQDASIVITCNTEPTATIDDYTAFEDIVLAASDINGSVNDSNDDSVLVNDTDAESEPLSVVSPGTYTTLLLGGEIVINSDGSFVYSPPADTSGFDIYNYTITDGNFETDASMFITIISQNDAPSFSILGDIDASTLLTQQNNTLQIPDFAFDILLGPANESDQMILQFNVNVLSDSNSILNNITVSNDGTLDLDFSLNYGAAIIQISLQDDGLTTNGGEDTSATVEFMVVYTDLIFTNGFEMETALKLFDFLESLKVSSPLNQYPTYDFETDSLHYYGHKLRLNNDYGSAATLIVQYWLQEILLMEEDQ